MIGEYRGEADFIRSMKGPDTEAELWEGKLKKRGLDLNGVDANIFEQSVDELRKYVEAATIVRKSFEDTIQRAQTGEATEEARSNIATAERLRDKVERGILAAETLIEMKKENN